MALGSVLEWFEQPVAMLVGKPVTLAEILGFVSGALCVWLVARQNVWNWPIGVVNNAFFALLFLRVGLYAESFLQLVFAALAIYGWWHWLFGGVGDGALLVRRMRGVEAAWLLLAGALATAAVAIALDLGTDSSVPFWDALVLAMSLVATYAQAQKLIESWWIWIGVDLVSIPLYVSRGLLLTAVLYAIFLCLCIAGLRNWTSDHRSRVQHGLVRPAEA